MSRAKGSVNAKTLEARNFCRSICEDPQYRASLLERARNNTLGPMESVVWAYAFGRPKLSFSVELSRGEEDLSELSMFELEQRNRELQKILEEAALLRAAIPAEFTEP